MNPTIKRVIIIFSFLLIIGIIIFLGYLFFAPAQSCSDHKQNQGEKGVDCGGPCSPCKTIEQTKDLTISEVTFAAGGNNTYDAVAQIVNPNQSVGAKNFQYKFTLKDAQGNVIATKEGSSFILPADTHFVAELSLATKDGALPTSIDVTVTNPQWEKLQQIEKPKVGIYDKRVDNAATGIGTEVSGIVRNESNYDLKKVSLVILLRDENGKIIGINTTEKGNMRVKEDRDFKLTWPYALGGQAQKMDVDAQVNVFDLQNFSVSS